MTIGAKGVKVYGNLSDARIINTNFTAKWQILKELELNGSLGYALGTDDNGDNLPLVSPFSYGLNLAYIHAFILAQIIHTDADSILVIPTIKPHILSCSSCTSTVIFAFDCYAIIIFNGNLMRSISSSIRCSNHKVVPICQIYRSIKCPSSICHFTRFRIISICIRKCEDCIISSIIFFFKICR